MTFSAEDEPFIWAVGIEDTNIGWPLGATGRGLDEYEATDHYNQWKSDFDLVAESGASTVRYGLPWYRINPARDQWEWEWADDVIAYAAGTLGLNLIIDLVHYGTPAWLEGSFTDPGYPDAVAEYAGRVAARYAGQVTHFTPLNEPLVTASFTGLRGIWPPHERGDAGWARVVVNVADGIRRTIRAIRASQPDSVIVHVEATHVWTTAEPGLEDYRRHLDERNFLPTDLVLGRVSAEHPLHDWLVQIGIPPLTLASLLDPCPAPDIIGLNYYPELSCRELVMFEGSAVGVVSDGGAVGLRKVVTDFSERYGVPILISETAVEGEPDHLVAWLQEAQKELAGLRDKGIPVIGLTWWPLFDFVDWSWGSDGAVIEEFYTRIDGEVSPIVPPPFAEGIGSYFRPMGLWRLQLNDDNIERVPTIASAEFRRLAETTTTSTNHEGIIQ